MHQRLIGLLALLTLAACGGAAPSPTATLAPAQPPATAAPAPTQAPADPPTAAPAPTDAAAPTDAPAQPAASPFSGIPAGKTAEGYNYLGDPAAPIELIMYSDYF